MSKIVILDGYAENPGDLSWEPVAALGELTVYDRTPDAACSKEKISAPQALITERISSADIVLTNKVQITEEIMDSCPGMKYIGVIATGYNVVDLAAATARGIVVTNIPAYSTNGVAQHAIALLLEICHHVGHHTSAVMAGKWSESPDFCFWDYPQTELAGKTMGIIGFGRIGQRVAQIAQALGLNVVVYSRHMNDAKSAARDRGTCNLSRSSHALPEKAHVTNYTSSCHTDEVMGDAEDSTLRYVTMDELLRISDVVSLHCQLTSETEGLINAGSIARMKDGVIIINTGRGPLINERDLANALNSGKVAAAGVDVVSVEPIRPDNPLLGAKNCIITPHIGWASQESRQSLMEIAAENIKQFLNGTPVNVVN